MHSFLELQELTSLISGVSLLFSVIAGLYFVDSLKNTKITKV